MKSVVVTLTILTAVIFAGCSVDRWVGVEPGQYVVADRTGTANTTASAEIRTLEIDRDKHRAIFTLVDGSESIIPFTPRDRAAWPSSCPTNINATRMEVLDLAGNLLTIGPLTFSQPILVRDCPSNPMVVVLGEDGAIGGGGAACAHLDRCIFFEPQTASALPTPPPASTPTSSPAANTPIPISASPTATFAAVPSPTTPPWPAADPGSLKVSLTSIGANGLMA